MGSTTGEAGKPPHSQGVPGAATTRDGRTLFYMQLDGPPGAPTVVFEAGLAATRSYWSLVQPAVAKWARAVAYDRSGLGRSPPDSQPRSLTRLSGDLNDLLDHLGEGPFILAAHSGGGVIVRAAAAARPERIAGLVLVDVTDEACEALFDPSFRRLERVAQTVSSLLARLGLLGALYRRDLAAMPADAREDMRREGFTVAAMRTRGAELTGLVAATEALRDRPLETPDIPIVAISGARADGGMSPAIRAAANASHAYRAGRSRQGRHVIAPNSGHLVPLAEPQIIVEEIRRLIQGVEPPAGA